MEALQERLDGVIVTFNGHIELLFLRTKCFKFFKRIWKIFVIDGN